MHIYEEIKMPKTYIGKRSNYDGSRGNETYTYLYQDDFPSDKKLKLNSLDLSDGDLRELNLDKADFSYSTSNAGTRFPEELPDSIKTTYTLKDERSPLNDVTYGTTLGGLKNQNDFSHVIFKHMFICGLDLSEATLDHADIRGAIKDSRTKFPDVIPDSVIIGNSGTEEIITTISDYYTSSYMKPITIGDLKKNKNFEDASFYGAPLSGLDLSNKNFQRANFCDVDLSNTKLDGSDLRNIKTNAHTTFPDVLPDNVVIGTDKDGKNITIGRIKAEDDFSGASLKGAILTGLDLSNKIFNGADLSGTRLGTSSLEGSDLRKITIDSNTVLPTILPDSVIVGTTDDGENVTIGNVKEMNDFRGVHLEGAPLSGLDLSNKDFSTGYLSHADLRKIKINAATKFDDGDLGTIILGTGSDGRMLTANAFYLPANQFPHTILSNIVFSFILQGKNFEHSDFSHTRFIEPATLEDCNVNYSNFSYADMRQIMISTWTTIEGCDFRGIVTGENTRLPKTLPDSLIVATTKDGQKITREKVKSDSDFSLGDFEGAVLNDLNLQDKTFPGANLVGAQYDKNTISVEDVNPAKLVHADHTYRGELCQTMNSIQTDYYCLPTSLFSAEDTSTLLTRYALQGMLLKLPADRTEDKEFTISKINDIFSFIERTRAYDRITEQNYGMPTRIGKNISALEVELESIRENLEQKMVASKKYN